MINLVSLIKFINKSGDKLLEKCNTDSTVINSSVFNNYFQPDSKKNVDEFLEKMYGLRE